MKILDDLIKYVPFNEQEAIDKEVMIKFLKDNDDAFVRSNMIGHMTASSWVVNKNHTKILMCYHKIYDSWSWTGGHADGDMDLLHVAIKEAKEESGVIHIRPLSNEIFSIETVNVNGHIKNGKFVPCHVHFNVSYLLEVYEDDPLYIKEDENTGVKWVDIKEAPEISTEIWLRENVYRKLNAKLKIYEEKER